MSFIPFYSAWGFMIFLLSVFLWSLSGMWLFLFYMLFATVWLVWELVWVEADESRHGFGFLVFIITELITFVSLFIISHFSMPEVIFDDVAYISEFDEYPLLGSIILLTSSLFCTAFHFNWGLLDGECLLAVGLLLGWAFLIVQFWEFNESSYYFLDCPYYVVAYSTVGLHFLHVLAGAIILYFVFVLEYQNFNEFYVEMCIWYWHFVDYVWLLVFIVFYYPVSFWIPF